MQDFSKISIEETLNKLNTSLRGLSDEEAEKRLKNTVTMKFLKKESILF